MPPASAYLLFLLAALTLLLVPGPAVLYVVSQSIDRGRQAGLASVHLCGGRSARASSSTS